MESIMLSYGPPDHQQPLGFSGAVSLTDERSLSSYDAMRISETLFFNRKYYK